MIVGWVFWIACVATFSIYGDYALKLIPNSVRTIPDFLMIGVGLIAHPIGLGGWIWVWGDNGPPQWASGRTADVIVGLVASGVLGAFGSSLFVRHRLRLSAALIVAAFLALVLVLSAVAKPAL
jgi:hypothetical protein